MRQTNLHSLSGKDEINEPQKCHNQGQNEFKDAGRKPGLPGHAGYTVSETVAKTVEYYNDGK